MATSTQDTKYQEDILNQWRDWRSFLDARQTIFDARTEEAQATFELTDTDQREQQAYLQIQSIPPARRTLFTAEVEQRQREVQQELDQERRRQGVSGTADPDEVERETLQRMRAECEGTSTADGRGMVPKGDGQWYSLVLDDLLDAPPSAYALKGKMAPQQRMVLLSGVGIVVVIALMVFLFFPKKAAPVSLYSDVPLANGQAIEPWDSTNLLLARGSETLSMAVRLVSPADPWPPQEFGETAWMWDAHVWPIDLCVPTDLEGVTGLTLQAPGLPDRIYTVRDADASDSDVFILNCANPSQSRRAFIRSTVPPPSETVGAAQSWSGGTLTLAEVQQIGPGHDPLLPAGRMRVRLLVTVDTPDTQVVDWPSLRPTLLLQSGEMVLAEQIEEQAPQEGPSRFRLTYLVPLASGGQALSWQVVEDDIPRVWRFTLPVPPSRQAVLHTLVVKDLDIQAAEGTQTGTADLTVQFVLHNPNAVPVTLQMNDMTLKRGNQAIPLPALDLFRAPLDPGVRQDVTFTTAVAPGNLVLTIGRVRTTITIAQLEEASS